MAKQATGLLGHRFGDLRGELLVFHRVFDGSECAVEAQPLEDELVHGGAGAR